MMNRPEIKKKSGGCNSEHIPGPLSLAHPLSASNGHHLRRGPSPVRPRRLSLSRPSLRAPLTSLQAGPSMTALPALKKKPSLPIQAAAVKRKRNDTPEETADDSTASQPARKPRDGPKKKKANRACYHCQKAHLTCDDCEPRLCFAAMMASSFIAAPPYSASMSALCKAWFRRQLHRGPSQKSKIPAGRGRTRCISCCSCRHSQVTLTVCLTIDHVIQSS